MAEAVNPNNLVNPLDQIKNKQEQGSDLIKNIVSNETAVEEQNILGDAPELDRSLIQDIEPPKSILLLILKILFGMIFTVSMASLAFFTSQLTDTFDFVTAKFSLPNISQELSSTNAEIIALQTDLNLNRYLEIKGYLDRLSFKGDSFMQQYEIANSQTSSSAEKKEAAEALQGLKADLKEAFEGARENYSKNFTAPLIDINFKDSVQLEALYQEKLKAVLQEKASLIANNADPVSKKDYRNYTQTMSLVGKSELKGLLIQIDFAQLSDKEAYEFVKKVNSLIINDLSTIQAIKLQRIKWSDIMNEIDLRTMAVDDQYSENFYDELGGIRYTNYDFESESRKIVIVGETKRLFDTTNFTLIADLIDEINKSKLFENAEMRTFNKSGSLEEGYVAVLKMAFNLQGDVVTAEDGEVTPDEIPEFLK